MRRPPPPRRNCRSVLGSMFILGLGSRFCPRWVHAASELIAAYLMRCGFAVLRLAACCGCIGCIAPHSHLTRHLIRLVLLFVRLCSGTRLRWSRSRRRRKSRYHTTAPACPSIQPPQIMRLHSLGLALTLVLCRVCITRRMRRRSVCARPATAAHAAGTAGTLRVHRNSAVDAPLTLLLRPPALLPRLVHQRSCCVVFAFPLRSSSHGHSSRSGHSSSHSSSSGSSSGRVAMDIDQSGGSKGSGGGGAGGAGGGKDETKMDTAFSP